MTDWIEWKGGAQPVSDDVLVEVLFGSGKRLTEFADYLNWRAPNTSITAYRIVKEGQC
ncbi:hypothetical protein [Aquamicrobium soli]|uniref:Uncharacterized protein n=1 Tax=Aquamicrobium soli TaxID=1811518 RepID=A0ABV7KEI8_9HYPH